MNEQNNGGPAFPQGNDRVVLTRSIADSQGMLLRDYFAAKAMQSHLTAQWEKFYRLPHDDSETNPFEVFDTTDMTEMAYEVADAMLKARAA